MPNWEEYIGAPVPANPDDVARAVALARKPVPADVQKLILAHQGQAPAQSDVMLASGSVVSFGCVLLAAAHPDFESYDIAYALAGLKDWLAPADGTPDFFPFATDTASGLFCVDLRDDSQRIVFVDSALGADDAYVFAVADTVTELLAKLGSR